MSFYKIDVIMYRMTMRCRTMYDICLEKWTLDVPILYKMTMRRRSMYNIYLEIWTLDLKILLWRKTYSKHSRATFFSFPLFFSVALFMLLCRSVSPTTTFIRRIWFSYYSILLVQPQGTMTNYVGLSWTWVPRNCCLWS